MNFSSESLGIMEVGQSLAKSLDDASWGEKEWKKNISQKKTCRNYHRNSLQTPRMSQRD